MVRTLAAARECPVKSSIRYLLRSAQGGSTGCSPRESISHTTSVQRSVRIQGSAQFILGSVQFGCLQAQVTAQNTSVRCSVRSLEAQLSSLLDVLGSVQFGCLQAQDTAQTTSVRCLVRRLEVQLSSLLDVLGSVQFGWCRHRRPPMPVQAMLSTLLRFAVWLRDTSSRPDCFNINAQYAICCLLYTSDAADE